MAPSSTPWDFDKIEELKRLWAEGYSGTDIAVRLGEPFSRCAVMGKLNRLGLQRHKPRQALRPRAKVRRRPVSIAPQIPPQVPQTPQPRTEPQPPVMRRLPLLRLEADHCRWPLGDPRKRTFCFCAADCEQGQVYCPYHMAKAFNKPRGAR